MERLLNEEARDFARKKFEEELIGKVTITLFTQEARILVLPGSAAEQECVYCKETRQLLEEIAELSDKINLKILDFSAEQDKAKAMDVNRVPALIIGENNRVRFFGIPSGYEFTSLLEAIIDDSRGTTDLSAETKNSLSALTNDIHIQVFVTPTCPYCPSAVRLAHQVAAQSPKVKADMVEATEFPHLSQKYSVYGVPKTVFNEDLSLEGAVPEHVFMEHLLKAAQAPATQAGSTKSV